MPGKSENGQICNYYKTVTPHIHVDHTAGAHAA